MSVAEGEDGRVLVYCHAGCTYEEILEALGLGPDVLSAARAWSPERTFAAQLCPPRYPPVVASSGGRGGRPHGTPVSTVHHVYVKNQVRLERQRFADGEKSLRWEHRVGADWEWGLGQWTIQDLPLYCQTDVRHALGIGEPVILCESESSVDALMEKGFYATTWAGGAGSPNLDLLREELRGGRVVWIPDHGLAGRRCSDRITETLAPLVDLVTIEPPHDQDARDLLRNIGGPGLRALIAERAGVGDNRDDLSPLLFLEPIGKEETVGRVRRC